MSEKVIVALDFPDRTACLDFLGHFDHPLFVKIGMELFYKEGPDLVRQIGDLGHRIFLDLKLHDIPNTVSSAMRALASLDVAMVNVHAAGGKKMMEAAKEGLSEGCAARGAHDLPFLIAVTQLTSTDQRTMNEELRIAGSVEETVRHYARLAKEAGLDGVVSSPLESPLIHEACGPSFLTVTPGVRFPGQDSQDQARVTSPDRARALGSDFIVMGRAITRAEDPRQAYERAHREFSGEPLF